MISDVAIANLALTKLGTARIIDFADPNERARAVSAIYDSKRDDELRKGRWRFAKRRTKLPELSTPPAFGYGHAYQMPADCLRVDLIGPYAVGDNLQDYRTSDYLPYTIEGRVIMTDLMAPLQFQYGARVTDPAMFDACFAEALACRLAIELCESLTSSNTKKQLLQGEYDLQLRTARNINAIEQPPVPLSDSSWVLSRL